MKRREKEKWDEILDRCHGDVDLAGDIFIAWKCQTDLFFLGAEILGMKNAKEKKRDRFDPRFHKWLADRLNDYKDTMIMVPRGHMKSTWMKVKIVQLIITNPLTRIGLFSRTSKLVEEQLSDIKRLLATPLLRRYFPAILPEPGKEYCNWGRSTMNQLTVRRDSSWGRIPQEEQVEAWGMGATITGRHYDVIVCDDIINEQSCSTPEQLEKVRSYYSYLQAIKEPDGVEYIIGTRYHFADIYGVIEKEGWFRRRVWTRQCIENGRPIYRFFTLKMLAKIRSRVGPYVWSCQYENNPVPKELQIFPPPYPTFSVMPQIKHEVYITVDPAATVKTYSDYSGIVVASIDSDGIMRVIEALQVKERSDALIRRLMGLMRQYHPRKVGIEYGMMTAFEALLTIHLDEMRQADPDFPMVTMEPMKIPRHLSKEARIERSLGAFIRDGRLFIHERCTELMDQMQAFPRGRHDDIIDALSMQFQLVPKFRGLYWTDSVLLQRRGRTFFDLYGDPEVEQHSWEDQFVGGGYG